MTTHDGPVSGRDTDRKLAWNNAALAGPDTLVLTSPDFSDGGPIPRQHAALRAGGTNLSPALSWTPAPGGTASLLLVIEDPDAPTRLPYVHCLALLPATRTRLDQGALDVAGSKPDLQLLRGDAGPGYLGPAPPKSHGAHRYVFELFALGSELITSPVPGELATMKPRDVLALAGNVRARGRILGTYQQTPGASVALRPEEGDK
jgi:Raf kinase inhibitor-like YbhB/YbcL family protein